MKKILVVYGPTATGKTDLALQLARKFQGELISADSRQVYKDLDIGTGKVNFDAQVEKHSRYWIVNGVKIYGFDLVNPQQEFSVADFVKFSSTTMIQIIESKKLPIIVGGTGFYIKALLEPIGSLGVLPNPELRKSLGELSAKQLYKKLGRVDLIKAISLNQSDRNNPRRLIRAIEIALYNKKLNTKLPSYPTIKLPNYLVLGLTAPNDYLYQRADNWLDMRIKHGLVKEVQTLIKRNINKEWLENLGLEYRWITRYLKGTVALDQAVLRLKGDIHSYIRRQKTYLRQFPQIKIFDISTKNWQIELEKKLKYWYMAS